jgi:tetratricopeptide (TPR) repeat protein
MNASEFSEAFLKANANREFIADQMADVFRELLRALSSDNGSGYSAAEKMDFAGELLKRCDEPLSWWQLFDDAIKIIRASQSVDSYTADYMHIAKRGMKYFVESSATDNAAKGRAATRLRDLQQAIKWQAESLDASPEVERTRLILQQNAEKLAGKRK